MVLKLVEYLSMSGNNGLVFVVSLYTYAPLLALCSVMEINFKGKTALVTGAGDGI